MRSNQPSRRNVLLFMLGATPLIAALAGCLENRHHRDDQVVVREERVVVRDPPPPPERIVVRESPPVERVTIVDSPTWYDDPRYTGHWAVDTRDRRWKGADRNVPR